ncbi:MAG: hypothetical protein J0L75_07130 [Spirochaetes bacterium]|nr:hypothetical protein [Spirochaetota bacterium]
MVSLFRSKWFAIAGWLISLAWAAPVAVWDPAIGGSETRFTIDRPWLDRVAAWLAKGGLTVVRLTANQMGGAEFNPSAVPVLMMPGDTIPRERIADLKRHADEGGVLIALDSRLPWLIAMEEGPDHAWRLSPREPKWAWQTQELMGHLGLEYLYDPPRHDTGTRHTLTALGTRYLAGAFSDQTGFRQGMWVVPVGGAQYIPIIRTRRSDGRDVVPLVAGVRSGKRFSIVCTDGRLTREGDGAPAMVCGLARLALDWREGRVAIGDADSLVLDPKIPILGPFSRRSPVGQVDPEGALPLKRWGRFDGSDLDLPPQTSEEGVGRQLAPGEVATLRIPERTQTAWLRAQVAFEATGAGLWVKQGEALRWNELFRYIDANGPGNYDSMDLGNQPVEVTRCVPLAPGPSMDLQLGNPGTRPIRFDAVQIETRPKGTPPWVAGAMVIDIGGPAKIPPELAKRWTYARADLRLNKVGPPSDPARWKAVDAWFAEVAGLGAPVHAVLMGCPEWLAISPERYADGKRAGRPHCVPPDPVKFAAFTGEVIERYGASIRLYEVWNEANIRQFYRGTAEEYAVLFKAVAAVIRAKAPGVPIVSAGMAGFNESYLEVMAATGALELGDQFGFHPYAGKAPGWDVPAGLLTGKLYSLGLDPVVYWDEMGFPWKPGEWFQGTYNPEIQALLTDRALARFTAGGYTRMNLFHGGGLEHHFSLISKDGVPYPAYRVFEDYLRLAEAGGRRLDVGLAGEGGEPLSGIYVAAALHADGRVTAVVNPAEAAEPYPQVTLLIPVRGAAPKSYRLTRQGVALPASAPRGMPEAGWVAWTFPLEGRTVAELQW